MQRRNFNKMVVLSPLAFSAIHPLEVEKEKPKKINRSIIKPAALKQGDKVALISPAGPINPEKFQNAVANLAKFGLIPVYSQTALNRKGYLAGDDDDRLADIHRMIADPEVKGLWCLRGGYGCTRIINRLDYNLIKDNPKIIIGYSDITSLLLAIFSKTGLVGFHGPVAISDVFSPFTKSQVQSLLFGTSSIPHDIPYQVQSSETFAVGHEPYIINEGRCTGELIGGNLSLLVCLPNTEFAPSYENKIVFIEDIGEKPYRIDRMLTFMLESTDLAKAAGIVLGVFNDCEATTSESSMTLKQVLIDRLMPLKIPCFYGFTFGHVTDICTFPVGIKATMDTTKLSVQLLEHGVLV